MLLDVRYGQNVLRQYNPEKVRLRNPKNGQPLPHRMIGLLALAGRRRLVIPQTTFIHWRNYALSRFPERRTGFGRSAGPGRKTTQGASTPTQSEDIGQQSQFTNEKHFSADDSQLWNLSQRMPSSDPEEGLKRLLLNNDTLVITRHVFLP